jgi:mannan endo-1,4-beta-mannosidase
MEGPICVHKAEGGRNVGYNGALGAGATTEFGFLGTWTGTNQAPTLTCTAS